MSNFALFIKLTSRASQLLPLGQIALSLPGIAEDTQRSLVVGDQLRIADIPNCPWFVVKQRFWDLGSAKTTLTLWLDEPTE